MSSSIHNIGVFAPSSWVEKGDIAASQKILEEHGYKVIVHPQTFARHNQSAGTNAEKLKAFVTLWNDPNIDIIWAAGGGNRCLHWIDDIDFASSKNSVSKPVIGFSDVTALINALYAHLGTVNYHGPTFNKVHKNSQIDHLLTLINSEGSVELPLPVQGAECFREGQTRGHLIGGNLSLFQYLPQTLPGTFWKNGILFLEDCNEELSRIDRMLLYLKRAGILEKVNGLIFGDFGNFPESGKPYGFTFKDIIAEHTEGLNVPIITNAPFGHHDNLVTFPVGKNVKLNSSPSKITLKVVQNSTNTNR